MKINRFEKLLKSIKVMGHDIVFIHALEIESYLTNSDFEVIRFRIAIAYDSDELTESQAIYLNLLNDGYQQVYRKLLCK